jgi:hypothetical protein
MTKDQGFIIIGLLWFVLSYLATIDNPNSLFTRIVSSIFVVTGLAYLVTGLY